MTRNSLTEPIFADMDTGPSTRRRRSGTTYGLISIPIVPQLDEVTVPVSDADAVPKSTAVLQLLPVELAVTLSVATGVYEDGAVHVGVVLVPFRPAPKKTSKLPAVRPLSVTAGLVPVPEPVLCTPTVALLSPVISMTWMWALSVFAPSVAVTVPDVPVPLAEKAQNRYVAPVVVHVVFATIWTTVERGLPLNVDEHVCALPSS